MSLPFLFFFKMVRCTFCANPLLHENKPFHLSRSGWARPRWWFSATGLLTLATLLPPSFGQQQPPRQRQQPGRSQAPRPNSPTGERDVRPTFEGDVKSVSKKELYISSETGNGLKFRITSKTTAYDGDKEIKVSALQAGQHVAVVAQFELDGSYNAVSVKLQAASPPHP